MDVNQIYVKISLKYINMLKILVMAIIFILTRFSDFKIQEKHDYNKTILS